MMTGATVGSWQRLIDQAIKVRENAYCPWSKFAVGAAIQPTLKEGQALDDSPIFVGCNVENDAYGSTICAERMAVGAMVAAGYQSVSRIVIAAHPVAAPCGACRQVLWQFNDKTDILSIDPDERSNRQFYTVNQLMPHGFHLDAPKVDESDKS